MKHAFMNISVVGHQRIIIAGVLPIAVSHPDDFARNVWLFTRLQKDAQIYHGIEIVINDGIKNIRPLFGWEQRLHLSELWEHPSESSLSILILNIIANYKHQYSSLYQFKHSDMSKIGVKISSYHGKYPSES